MSRATRRAVAEPPETISREGRGFFFAAFPKKRTGGRAAHAPKRPGRARFEDLERVDRRMWTWSRRGRRSFTRRVTEASALPRAYLGHLLQTRAGVRYATGIDFTDRVRSGYPGSAHRRVRTRPGGDVREETASTITLDAREHRSRGAGFGPRVTPKAMTSPRTSLHFSSRFNQVDPTQRRAVRAAYVHLVTRLARFGFCRFGASACSADCCESRKPTRMGN